MYHFANEILTTIGIDESIILVAALVGLFLALILRWQTGKFGWWAFAATCFPLLISLRLFVSCWQVNWETVDLLRQTNAITQTQTDLIIGGMHNDLVSILVTGSVVTLLLWGGLRLWFREQRTTP